ncbi:MAG: hypothetical protein NZ932_01390 [Candidatus Bathyarchaeota archaeon]|nr:hypothetical protein [Candidatus Bathyarchaeota archaeon]MDW8040093.1 hypothetical protein [Nitrososphaerota archaeon]
MKPNHGKLLIYAPKRASRKGRLKVVRMAAEKTAKALNLDFEVVAFRGRTPIYVYYKNGAEDPVPLYCDREGTKNQEEVCSALWSMMFVLSFHPKYSALKPIRRAFMRFS